MGEPAGETLYTYPMDDEPSKPDKYRIHHYGDHFDLEILDLDFYDGGIYICQIVVAAKSESAVLVVLSEFAQWSCDTSFFLLSHSPTPALVPYLFYLYVPFVSVLLSIIAHLI